MIFGNESISYYSKSNIAIWMALAFQAGVLNIGGFMACHRFVSHVTGFATFFGYEINRSEPAQALGMFTAPLFFLLGAILSGFLVDQRIRLHKRPHYFISFGIIFFLILSVLLGGIFGEFGEFGEPFNLFRDYILLALLCLTCGIQNGTVTTVSRSVIRTTHLTGLTTDLGIGIVRVLQKNSTEEFPANMMRLGLISFFILGSVVGGYVFVRMGYLGFIIPTISSGILFSIMIYFQLLKPLLKTR